MSTVDKLHILGIRSFGPEEKDKASIKFSSPLTLILGQNGCGKTTIIEALKYAACGDLPAGADCGSGFVHDPELANAVTVRGQVKLRFCDVRGKMNTVVRTVQVTRKIKKLEFKSLDSTFTEDNKSSISGRCADIDALSCCALGVSKPMLTNVIFCHQEDSAWPLEKGKKIKERFDSIFGVTEYNKCIDYICQLGKEMIQKKQILKVEVDVKSQNFEEAIEKRKKLSATQTQLAATHDQITNLQLEIEPIDAKMGEMLRKQQDFANHIAKVKDKKNRRQRLQEDIDELKSSIQEKFLGTKDELTVKIENFDRDLRNKQAELSERMEQKRNTVNEESRLQKEMSVKQMYLGTLQSQNQQNNDKIQLRNDYLKNLNEKLELPIPSNSQLNETKSDEIFKSVENKIQEYNQRYVKLAEEQDIIERRIQTKVDNVRENKVKLETDIKIKRKSMEDVKREMQKINADIVEVDKWTSSLNDLERNLENVNEELKSVTDSLNPDESKSRIRETESTIKKLESELSSLDEEIKSLNKITIEKANLDELKERKQIQEVEFSKLKEKNITSLRHLLTVVPETDFKIAVEKCIKKLTDEVKNTENRINENERKLSVSIEKKRHHEKHLQDKLRKINQDADKIEELCGTRDIDSFLSDLATKIEESQNVKGTISSSEFLFKRYVDKLRSEDPLCPLCRREFKDRSEIESLVDDLNQRLEAMPARLEEVKNQLSNWIRDQSKALQLKPIDDSVKQARAREIPQLKEEIKVVDSEIERIKQQLEDDKQALLSPETDENIAKNLLSDATLMDQYLRDIQNLEKKILDSKSKLPQIASRKTIDEANNERDKLKSEIDALRKKKEEEHQKLSTFNEKVTKLNEQKNVFTAQQLKIAGSVQKRKNLTEKQSELEGKEKTLMDELKHAETQLLPVSRDLIETTKEQARIRANHKLLLEEKKNKINEYEKSIDEIKKLQTAVMDYERKGGKEQLQATRAELAKMQLRRDELANLRIELEKEIEGINQLTAEEKIKKLDLDYNLKFFHKSEEITIVTKEIEELEGSTEIIDVEQFQRQYRNLQEQKKKTETQKSFAEGRQTELQRNIVDLERELNKTQYRNAEGDYRESMVKLTVLCKTIDDLKLYEEGMRDAMLNFHRDRMTMINMIIRELWRSIYRGNDIDHIEVETDEAGKMTESGRRNYNYRVVQVKNGVKLDMAGRCSAGQKVLACLIIRIALAETFSKNCGILALDEPTTNLDKDNVESLSAALAEIVERRSAQRHFQLIVITHDEDFLKKLHRVEKLESYLEVKRDYRGKSIVLKREV